jgi:hypothetical protein
MLALTSSYQPRSQSCPIERLVTSSPAKKESRFWGGLTWDGDANNLCFVARLNFAGLEGGPTRDSVGNAGVCSLELGNNLLLHVSKSIAVKQKVDGLVQKHLHVVHKYGLQ